jgi:hypothetical protein
MNKSRPFAIVACGCMCLAAQPLLAVNHTTNVQQAGGANWLAPAIWTPNDGLAPHAGDTYEAIAGGNPTRLRNPIDGNDVIFGGDSLKLNLSTEIRFKSKATATATMITFPNGGLILNGGLLNTGDDVQFTLAGNIFVTADSFLDTIDSNAPTLPDGDRSYNIAAVIAGAFDLQLLLGRTTTPAWDITGANNPFTGDWVVNAGWLKGTAPGSLGTGSITLTSTTTTSGTFGSIFETDYNLSTPGALTMIGTNSVLRLDQQLTFGAATINGTTLAPGTYTTAQLEALFPANIADVGSGSTATGSITVVPEPACGMLLTVGALFAARRKRH